MSATATVTRIAAPSARLLMAVKRPSPAAPTLHELRVRGNEAAERLRDAPRLR